MKWNTCTGLSMIRDFFSKFFQLLSLMQISKLLIFFINVTIGDVLTSKYISSASLHGPEITAAISRVTSPLPRNLRVRDSVNASNLRPETRGIKLHIL